MSKEALIRAMKTYIETGEGDAVGRRIMREALALLDTRSINSTDHIVYRI